MSQPAYQKTINVKATASTAYTEVCANAATLNFGGELLDDTCFTSTGYRSRVRGLKDYSLSMTLIYASTDSAMSILRSALLNGTNVDFQYLPNGTNGYGGTAVVETMNHSGDVGGLETIEVSMQAETALSTV